MNTLLVTGGAGFIGSHFIRYALRIEPEIRIINLDALTYAGNLDNVKDAAQSDRYTFVHGDINDRDLVSQVLRDHSIDTIVHFAAETHVDRSIHGPGEFIRTNVTGTFTLLDSARQYWLGEPGTTARNVRFHHVSTDEVYGSLLPDEPPWTEEAPYRPNSPYAASKASSDHLVRAYGHTYGLPCTISNSPNNYGPCQFPEKLLPLTILNASDNQPIPVYGDGGNIRDWLHVDDHCEAVWLILKNGTPGSTYHIGGGEQFTNLDIVRKVCALVDRFRPSPEQTPRDRLITFVADRPGHDRRYALDSGKIRRELGWKPRRLFESGLMETVEWYLANRDWVYSLRSKPDYEHWIRINYTERTDLRGTAGGTGIQ